MRCVYVSGTAKPRRNAVSKDTTSQATPSTGGFFSSLFSSFAGAPVKPSKPITVIDQAELEAKEQARVIEEQKKLMQMSDRSVVLSVFSASINVSLDDKMRKELQRATKKNPPSSTTLELIFVSQCFMMPSNTVSLVNIGRRGKTNMIRVRKRTSKSQRQPEVSSKGSEPILRGPHFFILSR